MEQRAQRGLDDYEEYLKELHTSAQDLEGLRLEDSDEGQDSDQAGGSKGCSFINGAGSASDVNAPEQAGNSEDLEKWLDDILGE